MIRPRRIIHQGVVNASGFFFDFRLVAEPEARRRILKLWMPGASLYRVAGGLVLRLPAPRHIPSAEAPGLPLLLQEGFLLAAPMPPDELKHLPPVHGALVLIRGGMAILEELTEGTREDPAAWLAVENYELLESVSLGEPPATPLDSIEPVTFEARTRLKGVPEEDPKRAEVIRSLRGDGETGTIGIGPRVRRGVFSMLSRLLSSPDHGSAAPSGSRRNGRGATGSARASGQRRSIRSFLLNSLWNSRLGRLLSIPHGRYLNRMVSMFERGDLLEALRHAIPLGGPGSIDAPPPGFRTPSARSNLDITLRGYGDVRSSLPLPEAMFDDLRQIYRRAFVQLQQQGKIHEAAFVLADLLHATAEAVTFLERHGELRLAAELAETRELPPPLVIRLWILAGESDRGVAIARRTGMYAPAIQNLEQTHPEKAEILRLLMADVLATSGDYAAAVDVLWPVEDSRHIALAWIDRAIENGGAIGARMLAQRLGIEGISNDGYYERALALLDDASLEGMDARFAFAQGLPSHPPCKATRTLARAAIRALGRDIATGELRHQLPSLRPLTALANDGALRADLPPLPGFDPGNDLSKRLPRLELAIAADDVGIGPVHDAALLPNGRLAVALGEAGVRLLARDGRVVAHFSQPAHRLVISDNGDRALALASRGTVWRIARIDFLTRRAESWCEATLNTWATSFDGSTWVAAAGKEVLVIDAIAERFQALWRWKDVGMGVAEIARKEHHGAFLVRTLPADAFGQAVTTNWEKEPVTVAWEVWLVDLASNTLRSRVRNTPPAPEGFYIPERGLSSAGSIADCIINEKAALDEGTFLFTIAIDGAPCDLALEAEEYEPLGFCHGDVWCAALFRTPAGIHCFVIHRQKRIVCARIILSGSLHATTRLAGEHLLLADDRGRILVLDLRSGRILRDLRVR